MSAGSSRKGSDQKPSPGGRAGDEMDSPSSSRPERRQHRRHSVANLRVGGPVGGDVINAGQLGMAIQTNESLTVGWSYAFRMHNGPEVIRIPGKIQWCRLVELLRIGENEFLPVFRMGVRLAGNLWGKPQVHYYP